MPRVGLLGVVRSQQRPQRKAPLQLLIAWVHGRRRDALTGRWSAVKLKPVRKLARTVTLKEIKADPALAQMELLTKFRLSVSAVAPHEWDHILNLAEG